MAICPIIVHFSTWRAHSIHDVACEFARAAVRSKDAQKQLARTSLSYLYEAAEQKICPHNPCPKLINVLICITIRRIPQLPVNTCVCSHVLKYSQKSLWE